MFPIKPLDICRCGERVGFELAGQAGGAVFPAPADDGGQKGAADSLTTFGRISLDGIQPKIAVFQSGKSRADDFAELVSSKNDTS